MDVYVIHKDKAGWYDGIFRTYTIRADKLSTGENLATAIHEYGHDIWFHRINETLKEEYKEIYKNENCVINEKISEDFAYSYENFEYYNDDFWRCTEKYNFFKRLNKLLEVN